MTDQHDKLNEIFETYKAETNGGLHNCLWQIMINDSLGDENGAFSAPLMDRTSAVQIACESGGYISAMFGFNDDVTDKRRDEICDDLNARIFGLTPDGAMKVVARSMRSAS